MANLAALFRVTLSSLRCASITSSAPITKRKETALKAYTQPTPRDAITSPPIAGPVTDAVCSMMLFKLIAFGRCSRGTSFGVSAWRAGRSKAPAAALTAVSR